MTVASVSAFSDPGTAAVLSRGSTTPRITDSTPTAVSEDKATTQATQAKQANQIKQTASVNGQEQEPVFDLEKLQKAADQIQAAAAAVDVNLEFRIDTETSIVQMVITDPETNEVVLEIPSEDVLKAAASLKDIIGLLIDTTV